MLVLHDAHQALALGLRLDHDHVAPRSAGDNQDIAAGIVGVVGDHRRAGRAGLVQRADVAFGQARTDIIGRVIVGDGGAWWVVGILAGDGADVRLLAGKCRAVVVYVQVSVKSSRPLPFVSPVKVVTGPSWSSLTTTLARGTLPVFVTT